MQIVSAIRNRLLLIFGGRSGWRSPRFTSSLRHMVKRLSGAAIATGFAAQGNHADQLTRYVARMNIGSYAPPTFDTKTKPGRVGQDQAPGGMTSFSFIVGHRGFAGVMDTADAGYGW